jgi:hypothetical protein
MADLADEFGDGLVQVEGEVRVVPLDPLEETVDPPFPGAQLVHDA